MPLATKLRDKPHARIYAEWMQLPAWRALDCFARALIVELLTRYRPTDENFIILSQRHVAKILNCSRPTATKAVTQLVTCGWLAVERKSHLMGPKESRPPAYSLTAQPRDPTLRAVMTFKEWRPDTLGYLSGKNENQQRLKNEPATDNKRATEPLREQKH